MAGVIPRGHFSPRATIAAATEDAVRNRRQTPGPENGENLATTGHELLDAFRYVRALLRLAFRSLLTSPQFTTFHHAAR